MFHFSFALLYLSEIFNLMKVMDTVRLEVPF
jgi:hypothetical protein